jgi:predicted Zn-dependent protease
VPRKYLRAIIAIVALSPLIAYFVLPYHPSYQEWRCKNQTLERLEQLKTQLPANPSLGYHLGLRLAEAGRIEEALEQLRIAASLDPDSAKIVDAIAATQMLQGNTRPALQLLTAFYEGHPNDVEAPLMLARFFLTTKSFGPALSILRGATQKFSKNAECWALLANGGCLRATESGTKGHVSPAEKQ